MQKKYRHLLKIIVSISILVAIFLKVGVKETIVHLKNADLMFIILIVCFQIITLLLGATNIFILAQKMKKDLTFRSVLKDYLIIWPIGLFFPSKLSDVGMVYLLKKRDIEVGKAVATMIIDNAITLWVIALFSLIGIYAFFGMTSTLLAGMLIIVGIALGAFLISPYAKNFVKRVILKKKAVYFKGFSRGLTELNEDKSVLLVNIFLTVLKLMSIFFTYHLAFLAINKTIEFSQVIQVTSISRLATFLPITINGLGLKEGIAIYLFNILGVAGSVVLSASLIVTITTYLAAPITLWASSFIPGEQKEKE